MSDPLEQRLLRLPGWELIAQGLIDCGKGSVTPAACLVCIAEPRLRRAGLIKGGGLGMRMDDPELQLYRMLRREGGNGFGRYQAMLRRLIRFEHALDRELYRHGGRLDEIAVAEEGE